MELIWNDDGRWTLIVGIEDVPCGTCWSSRGESCTDREGRPLTRPAFTLTKSDGALWNPGPPFFHRARWERAARRGVVPTLRATREECQRLAAGKTAEERKKSRRSTYGKDWNP